MFTYKLISVNHLLTLTSQNDWRIIMANMFCFQCQQTAGNKGCINTGVCGKQPETAHLQDELVYELIRLATAAHDAHKHSKLTDRLLIDGLFTTLTNVNFDDEAIRTFTDHVRKERCKLTGDDISLVSLWDGANDIVSLRSTLLFGMKGMAAYAHHAMNLGYMDDTVIKWFYKGLCEINKEHTPEEWIDLIIIFVISLTLKPAGSPKNSIAQIVDNKSAITGVPRNSRIGCTGSIK